MSKKSSQAAPTITIRNAEFKDISNIFRVAKAQADVRNEELDVGGVHQLVDLISGHRVYVADLSGRLVGALAMQVGNSVGEIVMIVVQHGFEKAGIYEVLLKHALDPKWFAPGEIVRCPLKISDPAYEVVANALGDIGAVVAYETHEFEPNPAQDAAAEPEPDATGPEDDLPETFVPDP